MAIQENKETNNHNLLSSIGMPRRETRHVLCMYRTYKALNSNLWGCVKIGAASFCNLLKNIKQSPDFHKPGLCHVRKFL